MWWLTQAWSRHNVGVDFFWWDVNAPANPTQNNHHKSIFRNGTNNVPHASGIRNGNCGEEEYRVMCVCVVNCIRRRCLVVVVDGTLFSTAIRSFPCQLPSRTPNEMETEMKPAKRKSFVFFLLSFVMPHKEKPFWLVSFIFSNFQWIEWWSEGSHFRAYNPFHWATILWSSRAYRIHHFENVMSTLSLSSLLSLVATRWRWNKNSFHFCKCAMRPAINIYNIIESNVCWNSWMASIMSRIFLSDWCFP